MLFNVPSGKSTDAVLIFLLFLSLDKRSDCCGYNTG